MTITVFFLLLHKLSFYNKCNAILFCLIKNFISFHFFFPGGWLLVSNVVVGNPSSLWYSFESSYREIRNCHNKSLFLKRDAMKKLRTHLSFTQLRFHHSKNKGRSPERNPIQNLLMVVISTGVKLTCKIFLDPQKYLVVIFSKVAMPQLIY